MATYIRGESVANATTYELFEKVGNRYNSIATNNEIDFHLEELGIGYGTHTLAVKAKADGYMNSDYSNEVVYTKPLPSPLVDISMLDGKNMGWGGNTYMAVKSGNSEFSNGKFRALDSSGYLNIPIDFITSKTSKFTAFFVFDNWTRGNAKYGRFFRFNSDVPNMYLNDPSVTNGDFSIRFKLLNNFTTETAGYVNSSICLKEANSNYYYVPVRDSEKLAVAVRCDGTEYSFWKDGILVAKMPCTVSTPDGCTWTALSVGDEPQVYALGSFECSKISLWDDALTDDAMAALVG